MDSLLNFGATIAVAIISLVGIWIQTRSKERQENINKKLDDMRRESKEGDVRINAKLDENKKETLKVWLVNEMTKIRDGYYVPNEEQKKLLHECKKEYNDLNGDSYVDDMFDGLREDHLL